MAVTPLVQYGPLPTESIIKPTPPLILGTLRKLHTIIKLVRLIELETLPGERQAVTVVHLVQLSALI